MINFNVLEQISLAGSPSIPNQDYVRIKDKYILLLDGATSLADNKTYPVEQFVVDFAKIFDEKYEFTNSIIKSILEALEEINYLKKIPKDSFPSASGVILNTQDNKLFLTQIGDCKAYCLDEEHIKAIFPTSRIEMLDSIALNLLAQYQNIGFTTIKSKELIKPTLQNHRQLKNTEEGYASISIGLKQGINQIQYTELVIDEGKEYTILLASDGFYNGFENYLPETLSSILRKELSLINALKTYRKIEAIDKNLQDFPRFKQSDDASAVLITLGRH